MPDYPMPTLKLSLQYLLRESHVDYWLREYIRRNHIEYVEADGYLTIYFNSLHHRDCLVWRGNREYPYFEFL